MTAVAQLQRSLAGLVLLVVMLSMVPSTSIASMQRSRGQTIYLSVIPQIQGGPRLKNNYLELLMAVRNIDLQHPVKIQSITYHNAGGKIEKKVLSKALTLAPLASHTVLFDKQALAIPTACPVA